MAKFANTETELITILKSSKEIYFNNNYYNIKTVAKPSSSHGEPKTDIFIELENADKTEFIKISVKQKNADFLENKMTSERAEVFFGTHWQSIIEQSTLAIKNKFEKKPLIFKEKYRRTEKGAITLGWKYEFLNKLNGELSAEINIDLNEVYKGINLPDDKKNALINGCRVNESGVANYLLFVNATSDYENAQNIIDKLIPIDEYIQKNPKVYFACKALNYRTMKVPAKWDGNRPLSVFVNWTILDGKLHHELVYNSPLTIKGNEIAEKLKSVLYLLNIQTTDDITTNNLVDSTIVYK